MLKQVPRHVNPTGPAEAPHNLDPAAVRVSIVAGLIQKTILLPMVVILAACSTGGQRANYRPKSLPEYRAEAEHIVTGKITDGRLAFIDPTARIQLQPSPGYETNPGQEGFEVLNSRADSGGYFAFVQDVPVTQYFRIVRQADCETTSTMTLITPALVKTAPDYYIKSKRFFGDKPQYKCLGDFSDRFRTHTDKRLEGSDGAVFDNQTLTKVENKAHFFLQTSTWRMAGWAIKFANPSHEEIVEGLRHKVSGKIYELQQQTLLFWIQKNRFAQYNELLTRLLPVNDPYQGGLVWRDVDIAILRTLATAAPEKVPNEVWLKVLEKGIAPGKLSPSNPVVTQSMNAADIAANVLACKKDVSLVPRLEAVVRNAGSLQHKVAAAKALKAMGRSDIVVTYIHSANNDFYRSVATPFSHPPFACPYTSAKSAKD
ncbi:MAG: hypothetical protein IPJ48_14885 [Propionivibrio sp.]|uniref:Uncharacterized protein n=1 Tax=Candidatus Propionivibrio dominans TaxID=2954373 RepID=A0A9D7F8V0_9RHOO|nr:hypothetical protein [Candidatus Propionivibrio dominans]